MRDFNKSVSIQEYRTRLAKCVKKVIFMAEMADKVLDLHGDAEKLLSSLDKSKEDNSPMLECLLGRAESAKNNPKVLGRVEEILSQVESVLNKASKCIRGTLKPNDFELN